MGMKPFCHCTVVPHRGFITLRKYDSSGNEIWHRDDGWDVVDMCLSPDGQTIFTCGNDKNGNGQVRQWDINGNVILWTVNNNKQIQTPDIVLCIACDSTQVYVGLAHLNSSLSIVAYSYAGVQNWAVDLQAETLKIAAGNRLDLWTFELYSLNGNTNQIQRLYQNNAAGTFSLTWNGQTVAGIPTNPTVNGVSRPLLGSARDADSLFFDERYSLAHYLKSASNIYDTIDIPGSLGNLVCSGGFNSNGNGFIDMQFEGVYSGWPCPLFTVAGVGVTVAQVQAAAGATRKRYVQMSTGGAVNGYGPVGGMPHPDSDYVGGGGWQFRQAEDDAATESENTPGLLQLDPISRLPNLGVYPSGALTDYPNPTNWPFGSGFPQISSVSFLKSGAMLCAGSDNPPGAGLLAQPGSVYKQSTSGAVLWKTIEILSNSVFIDANDKHYAGGSQESAGYNGLPQHTTDCFDANGNILWIADHSTKKTPGVVTSVQADANSILYTSGNRVRL